MKALITVTLLTSSFVFAEVPSIIPSDEVTSTLLENKREIKSLAEIENLGLNSGTTKLELWSGHYWPHFQGSLAVRYRDPLFIKLIKTEEQFGKFKELASKNPSYKYYGREDQLSPAEKYDMLVGDYAKTLTKSSWELGSKSEVFGAVPTWRGICDGFASASQMLPRPKKMVSMKSVNGQTINFYPEDIKALGSLLFARNQEAPIFLGKRCTKLNKLNPFDKSCEETNPGTFHKALVNRVGVLGKSFIADVSPGTEVWNYPVKSYSFKYYNVFTGEESSNFRTVMEYFSKKGKFANKSKRSKGTFAIVGVKATVNYQNMRWAHLKDIDSEIDDSILTKEYDYDLELDYQNNIIGGESFSGNLPDFIWAPQDEKYPLSTLESERGMPRNNYELTEMARASSKEGEVLAYIVKQLFLESSK